ncbi:hypothetical protein [Staphylococcus hominis]
MGSEFGISLVLVGIVLSLNFFEGKLKKDLFTFFKIFLLVIVSFIYILGLTPSTSTYRAFLIFIGLYLILSITINCLIFYNVFSKIFSKYTSDYTKINNVTEFKNKNLNTRLTIYGLAFIVSVINYYCNKWEDINNVFTTVIIMDVILDLILSRSINNY